jgi:Carboxypeptidase regulatory-like domain
MDDWRPRTARVSLRLLSHGLLVVLLTACDTLLSVRGRVTDRRDGAPIASATVTFYGSGMPDTGYRIATDSQGQFEVRVVTGPLPRLDSFTVAAASYSTTTIRPTQRELPVLEVQLAKPLYSEPPRLLGELTQRPVQ